MIGNSLFMALHSVRFMKFRYFLNFDAGECFRHWKFVGAAFPSILTLIFIIHYGVNVIIWDEIDIIPLVKAFFKGGPWLSYLFLPHDQHLVVFPSLLIIANAVLTSWNVVWEVLFGWFLMNVSLVVLWKLLCETVADLTWTIVPISWLLFLFEQSGNYLSGFTALSWYMAISSFLLSIYFLSQLYRTSFRLVFFAALLFAYLASFSNLLGMIVWPMGLASFVGQVRHRMKSFLFVWLIAGGIATVVYLKSWITGSFVLDPANVLPFFFAYLGAGLGAWMPTTEELETLVVHHTFWFHAFWDYSLSSEFGGLVAGLLYCLAFGCATIRVRRWFSKLIPWFQIAGFGVISAAITAIGRFSLGGLALAVSSRYVAASVLFLIPGLVFIFRALDWKSPRTVFQLSKGRAVFMVLFLPALFLSYVDGWQRGVSLYINRVTSLNCLERIGSSAYKACLETGVYPNYNVLQQRIADLNDLCLGVLARCSDFSPMKVILFVSTVAAISLACWHFCCTRKSRMMISSVSSMPQKRFPSEELPDLE